MQNVRTARPTVSLQGNSSTPHNASGEPLSRAGTCTSISEIVKDPIDPSHLQKNIFRPLRTSGKKVSSKFLNSNMQGLPGGVGSSRTSFETERFKHGNPQSLGLVYTSVLRSL